jgi:hypothetical protein
MQVSYKYRLYPTRAQVDALGEMLRDFRALYSAAFHSVLRRTIAGALAWLYAASDRIQGGTGAQLRLRALLVLGRATTTATTGQSFSAESASD